MQNAQRMTTVKSTTTHKQNAVIAAMSVGVILTVVAAIVPFVTGSLRDHIRAGYPGYTNARVDTAVTNWLIILTIVGALGVVGWVFNIWIVATNRRWAAWFATATFALGTSVALTDLLVKDTSGDTGLAPLMGWIGMLPCLAGLAAVALLWRRSPVARRDNARDATRTHALT